MPGGAFDERTQSSIIYKPSDVKKRQPQKSKRTSQNLLQSEHWLIEHSNLGTRGRTRVALVFPNTYYVGMSNLGIHFCLETLLNIPGCGVERFFLPGVPTKKEIVSLETSSPLHDFPLILFSVSSELDYLNIIQILKNNGIAQFKADRTRHDPMLVAGGFAISLNPLPMADIFDLFVIGDGELSLPYFMDTFLVYNGDKDTMCSMLQGRKGFYIPDAAERQVTPTEIFLTHAGKIEFTGKPASSIVLTPNTEFSDTLLIEISRGCPHACNFCFVGHNLNPWRYHHFEVIVHAIEASATDASRVGFVTSALPPNDVMEPLLRYISNNNISTTMSSLRINEVNSELIATLVEGGQQTLTLAPECGTDELRRYIGKYISTQQLFTAIEICLAGGIRKIKLYMMIGLPGETEHDVDAIADLLTEIEERYSVQYDAHFSASIGIFTPRPGTPFAGESFCGITSAKNKISVLKGRLHDKAFKGSITAASPHEAALETLLGNYNEEAREFIRRYMKAPGKWRDYIRSVPGLEITQ